MHSTARSRAVLQRLLVGARALADEFGQAGRGVMVSQVMPFPFSTTTPLSREYLAAVRRAGPEAQPNDSSMEGYLAAQVFAEASSAPASRRHARR